MTRPVVGSVAEHVYASLEPGGFTARDEEHDWALLHYVEALCRPMQMIYEWAGEEEADLSASRSFLTGPVHPGWSKLLDVDRAPDEALRWLAQFVGVKLGRSMDYAQQRAAIRERAGWRRGTPAMMVAAVQATLTGSKTVVFRERYDVNNPTIDSAYHLTVYTMQGETPDAAATLAALVSQKPAGIVLHYETRTGDDWDTFDNTETWTTATDETWAQISGTN